MPFRKIAAAILQQYELLPSGIHGVAHWARVQENGLRLARLNGADEHVIRLFALFHDACRRNDRIDNDHGRRGAELARRLRGDVFDIDDEAFDLLEQACNEHTDGHTDGDVTVVTCWDADRLDLGRAGITPDSFYLGNRAARDGDLIAWAHERSCSGFVPDLVHTEWGIEEL